MAARTITETRLAPRLSIDYNRFRNPATGVNQWQLTVSATILDQNGDMVRQVEVSDVFAQLNGTQQTGLQNLADIIVTKLTQRFEIASE